jgi:hypothetical protein
MASELPAERAVKPDGGIRGGDAPATIDHLQFTYPSKGFDTVFDPDFRSTGCRIFQNGSGKENFHAVEPFDEV